MKKVSSSVIFFVVLFTLLTNCFASSSVWTVQWSKKEIVVVDLEGVKPWPKKWLKKDHTDDLLEWSEKMTLFDLKRVLVTVMEKEYLDRDEYFRVHRSIVNNVVVVNAIKEYDLELAKKVWAIYLGIVHYTENRDGTLDLFASRTRMAIEKILVEEMDFEKAQQQFERFGDLFNEAPRFHTSVSTQNKVWESAGWVALDAQRNGLAVGAFSRAIGAGNFDRALLIKGHYPIEKHDKYQPAFQQAVYGLAEKHFKSGEAQVMELNTLIPVPGFEEVMKIAKLDVLGRHISMPDREGISFIPTPEELAEGFLRQALRIYTDEKDLATWAMVLSMNGINLREDKRVVGGVIAIILYKADSIEKGGYYKEHGKVISVLKELYGFEHHRIKKVLESLNTETKVYFI